MTTTALHDVTQHACKTGIRIPVAFTDAAWSAAIAFDPADPGAITERRTEVLTVVALHLFSPEDELPTSVRVRPMLYPLGPRIPDWIDLVVRANEHADASTGITIALASES